jgi:hypothetical protein
MLITSLVLTFLINRSLRFSMIRNVLNAKTDNDLIHSSAIISLMNRYFMMILFWFIISLTQCQRISICFVLLWNSELMIKSIALLLSVKISMSWLSLNFSSRRNSLIQIAFLAVFDRIIYSVSQYDKTIMSCCLNEWINVSFTNLNTYFFVKCLLSFNSTKSELL